MPRQAFAINLFFFCARASHTFYLNHLNNIMSQETA